MGARILYNFATNLLKTSKSSEIPLIAFIVITQRYPESWEAASAKRQIRDILDPDHSLSEKAYITILAPKMSKAERIGARVEEKALKFHNRNRNTAVDPDKSLVLGCVDDHPDQQENQ